MAKQKKKGQAGQAKNYITRTQAVRKLQISLPDFRRLCIFKGIYPREPRNIKKANKSATHSTTFYYTKDIQYLLHEPLLAKFRDQKALQKKIARSLGRNEVQDAMRLDRRARPKMKLDHIVRERYPTFVDALRDLDDALSLLFLFASLPSTETVPPKIIARCQRLCHEFEHYLISTNSLRKTFLSIKGIYYQATIQGQDIMWLVPYKFVQRVTGDVDYRIMGTFVEFYCTLLGFVNYRLYSSIGLVYPPKFDMVSDENGAELAAFTLEGRTVAEKAIEGETLLTITNGHTQNGNSAEVQAVIDRIGRESTLEDKSEIAGQDAEEVQDGGAIDKFESAAPGADELPQPEISGNEAATLFADFTFFISREAPRHAIEFLIRAFGCKRIGWDKVLGDGAFTHDEQDPRITHQIVDRPAIAAQQNGGQNAVAKPAQYVAGRIYVQPQWIWDCVNEGRLIRTDLYAPGAILPPHLSPWMKPVKGQYDPRATLEEQQLEGEDDEIDEDDVEVLENGQEVEVSDNEEDEEDEDAGMALAASDASDDDENDTGEENIGFSGFADEEEPDNESEAGDDHEAELAAEAAGNPLTKEKGQPSVKDKKKQARSLKEKQEAEELERRKMMMSNKKRKLFEKMQYSNEQKDAEAKALRQKRRKIERRQKA